MVYTAGSMKELGYTAAGLLERANKEPASRGEGRGKRAAVVRERTLRFYIGRGLVDAPEGAGPAARYGRRHLWQLTAIRRLQAKGLTLSAISHLVAGKSEADLGRMCARLTDPRSRGYESYLYEAADSEPPSALMVRDSGPRYSESMSEPGPDETTVPSPARWERFEISDGVEIQVRDDIHLSREALEEAAARIRRGLKGTGEEP